MIYDLITHEGQVVDTVEGENVHDALIDTYPPEFFILAIPQGIYGMYGFPSGAPILFAPKSLQVGMAGPVPWDYVCVMQRRAGA